MIEPPEDSANRPDGPPLPAPRAPAGDRGTWGALATLGLGLTVLVLYTFAQGLPMLAALPLDAAASGQPAPASLDIGHIGHIGLLFALGTLVAAPLGILLTLVFARARRGLPVREYLGLARPGLRATLVGLLLLGLFSWGFDALSSALGRPQVPVFMVEVYQTAGSPFLLALAVVVAAPAFEELLFRGFLFEGLRRSPLGGIGAVLLPSLVFAAVHLQYDLFDMSAVFVLGLLFAVVRLQSRSLYLTFGLHALSNLVALVQVALAVTATS